LPESAAPLQVKGAWCATLNNVVHHAPFVLEAGQLMTGFNETLEQLDRERDCCPRIFVNCYFFTSSRRAIIDP
jgi:hypothetical protein